jgi:hypothetical protein
MLNKKTGLINNGQAETVIGKMLLVALGASYGLVKVATGPTDIPCGVSTEVDEPVGATADFVQSRITPVIYGGAVGFGDALTSDASGKAVKASAGDYVWGYAQMPGAADEVGSILVQPGAKST